MSSNLHFPRKQMDIRKKEPTKQKVRHSLGILGQRLWRDIIFTLKLPGLLVEQRKK